MYVDYLKVENFGIFKIVANDNFLISVNVVLKIDKTNKNHITDQTKKQLLMYFDKKLKKFNIPIDLSFFSDFSKKALNGLLKIDYAKTISYKDLAKIAGNENAFRATGSAIGKNPYIIILPCHRVIKSNQNIGNYTCVDKSLKQKLIDFEKSNA